MVVSILGCGWYGRALALKLIKNGIKVKGSATTAESLIKLDSDGIMPYLVKFEENSQLYDPDFFNCDVLIVSISPGFKKGRGEDYLLRIGHLVNTIIQQKVKKVIHISSTGVYGDCNKEVDELDEPNPDTMSGNILLVAERLLQEQTSAKVTILRFGGLVGPGRHPGRFFLGKTEVPNGLAPVNLIHQIDCVGITEAVIEKDLFGYLFNACSPDHPVKAVFYSDMALKFKQPVSGFINELKKWKLINSINLTAILGYSFSIKSWKDYPGEEI